MTPRPYATGPVAGKPPTRSGKVRDLYDLGDRLLLVASDRISAFDVILRESIPGKGIVLTALTDFWLERTAGVVASHRVTSLVDEMPFLSGEERERLRGRAMLCAKAEPYPFEFVVRGYVAGSGWSEYRRTGAICGIRLPAGLRESDELPEPILTPTTKEEAGHDRPVEFADVSSRLGRERADRARAVALELYRVAAAHADGHGVLLADTKFELGEIGGKLALIDEVLTPDSSRFWPADGYQPGKGQPSFDKQIVRDYLASTGWSKTPPPPPLPAEVIARTSAKYEEICERLTGRSAASFAARRPAGSAEGRA